MDWIHEFQLFLFDFDGLLVSTEPLHYQAYSNALAKRGHAMPLTLAQFFTLAHVSGAAWKEALYAAIPTLEKDWERIYRDKQEAYFALAASGHIALMPGVEALLQALKKAKIQRCVVTHAMREQTLLIRSQLPVLNTIDHWITREDYGEPKPNPECYLKAIAMYGKPGDRIIGFEDSLRGLTALLGTAATAVLICPQHYPHVEIALQKGGVHFPSLEEVFF